MWQTLGDPMQLVPTGIYTITTNQGPTVSKTIALGPTLTSQPTFPWQPGKEQWFSPFGTNLADTLEAAQTIFFKLNHRADKIDSQIQATANQLANTNNFKFQLYAQSVLGTNNWTPGVPSYGPSAYYFEEENPQDPNTMMRLLFNVDQGNPKKLVSLSWVVLVNTVSVYFQGVPDGTTYGLARTPVANIPTNGYYYTAVAQ